MAKRIYKHACYIATIVIHLPYEPLKYCIGNPYSTLYKYFGKRIISPNNFHNAIKSQLTAKTRINGMVTKEALCKWGLLDRAKPNLKS